MTTNHIGQLAQWYADAEQITKTNLPNKGDTLISPYEAGGFGIELERDGWTTNIVTIGEPVRILARAPKPKPAWHDAVAVIASTDYCERQVWQRDTTQENRWYGTAGDGAVTGDLRDVTPLIEQKVTDEMVLAALNASTGLDMQTVTSFKRDEIEDMRLALTAALGLEDA